MNELKKEIDGLGKQKKSLTKILNNHHCLQKLTHEVLTQKFIALFGGKASEYPGKNKKENTPSNITQYGDSVILDFTTKRIF